MRASSLVLAALVGALVPAPALAAPDDFEIVSLSNRPDMVSGGDALVRIDLPRNVPASRVRVSLNRTDVTAAFRADAASGSMTGLVLGMRLGDNRLEVRSTGRGGESARLTLVNHRIQGPVFSGPQEQPYICQTHVFTRPVFGGNLGPALDADCSIATRVDYAYRSTDGTLKPLPSTSARPADLAMTTTLTGAQVPYIVRIETGTIDRAIYQTSILHDPTSEPSPDPWTRPAGWNGRLIYTFGGGCHPGWYFQGRTTGGVIDNAMLSQGYGVASSSLNVSGNNCNHMLAAEAMMMVKERFIEAYGAPLHTIGWGCSGGSFQQHQIAENYPGLLDGILPGCSFPEVLSTTVAVTDARLLLHYFTALAAPGSWTQEQLRAASGLSQFNNITRVADMYGRNWTDPTAMCPADLPLELRYHPVTNRGGARCNIYDHTVNVFGRDPVTGFARRPLDNVGVQYGLAALESGAISKAQFLDLNEKIGGLDIDSNFIPERTVADVQALRAAYRTGRIMTGGGGLKDVPIIDYRAYSDDLAPGDIHQRYHSFSTRERLVRANGHADNQVMVIEDFRFGYYSSNSPVLREVLRQMDRWLLNIEADRSNARRSVKVVRNKPADLQEGCWTRDAVPVWIPEKQVHGAPGICNAIYPSDPDPRIAAGEPLANDVHKCRLKDIDPADYLPVSFDAAEMAHLRTIFPRGVCDWSRRGVAQRGLAGTWISFGGN